MKGADERNCRFSEHALNESIVKQRALARRAALLERARDKVLNGHNLWICGSLITVSVRVNVCLLFHSPWRKATKCGSIT